MKAIKLTFALFALGTTAAGLGCFTTDFSGTCADDGRCPASDAGPDGNVPLGCDTSKEPQDSLACLDNTFGVFAAPSGDDKNSGKKESPVQTLGKAISLAAAGKLSRIYLGGGTYASEALKLEQPISIYGGWSVPGWTYSGTHAVFTGPVGAVALSVRGVSSGITIADVDVAAPDATAPGGSSVAALIADSTVAIRRASFSAGKGVKADDQPSPGGTFDPATAPGGNSGTGMPSPSGGDPKTNDRCSSTGGKGGAPSASGTDGEDGSPAIAPVPTNSSGKKGTVDDCNSSTGGRPGSNAPGGVSGDSAQANGVLTATGWTPQAGKTGAPGGIGQGGGGGASINASGGGGSGGPGGCGGAGGAGGAGGGSSIALALLNATVTIDASTFSAREAGNGGKGGGGQVGQAGGGFGNGGGGSACQGGRGGAGGSGGGGGGGAGGLSAGIVWKGNAPTIGGTVVQDAANRDGFTVAAAVGQGGAPGAGAAPAVTLPPPNDTYLGGKTGSAPGKSGVSAAIVPLP